MQVEALGCDDGSPDLEYIPGPVDGVIGVQAVMIHEDMFLGDALFQQVVEHDQGFVIVVFPVVARDQDPVGDARPVKLDCTVQTVLEHGRGPFIGVDLGSGHDDAVIARR